MLKSDKELRTNPIFKEELIGQTTSLNGTPAQNIGYYTHINKFGKEVHRVTGKTKTATKIANRPTLNFGSIAEYDVDGGAGVNIKGMSTTIIRQDLNYKGRVLPSRRFMSRVLSVWGMAKGYRYNVGKSKEAKCKTAIGQMCRVETDVLTGKKIETLSLQEVKFMIKDLIKEIRRGNKALLYYEDIKVNQPSDTNLIEVLSITANKKGNIIEEEELDTRFNVWVYPKYNINYLQNLLEEIDSGNYLTTVYQPIIYDLFNFPKKCTIGINPKQLESEDLNNFIKGDNNLGDYDLNNYLYERE